LTRRQIPYNNDLVPFHALLPLAIAILEASSVSQDGPYNQIESNTAIEMPMLRGEPHDGLD
jgi:hypothetical protein